MAVIWVAFTGCSLLYPSKEVDSFAKDYVELLRNGNITEAIKITNEKTCGKGLETNLPKVAKFLQHDDYISIEYIGSMKNYSARSRPMKKISCKKYWEVPK